MNTPKPLQAMCSFVVVCLAGLVPAPAASGPLWLALGAAMAAPQASSQQTAESSSHAAPGNPVVVLETSKGIIKIELFPEAAPKTVENFLHYVDSGFYNDTIFHRAMRGFVVQGGGFTPELEEKPTLPPVPIETSNGIQNDRGTVAMARTRDRNSATSQFFVNLSDNEQLNRKAHSFGYTVFGRVIEGMEIVDRISNVQTSRRGNMDDIPILPVFLNSARRQQP